MSAHHTQDLKETTSITNPKPTVDIRAYGLYGCWETVVNVDRLVVYRAAPDERTPT